jgi:hypothetical protein
LRRKSIKKRRRRRRRRRRVGSWEIQMIKTEDVMEEKML